jgi:alkaline phosphatase D
VGTPLIQLANPHIKFIDLDKHGYILLHVTRGYVQCDWYFMNTVNNPNRADNWQTGWYVLDGERHLRRALVPAPSPVTLVPQAPLDPPNLAIGTESPHTPIIFSASPNPFYNEIVLEYYNPGAKDLMMRVISAEGKMIWEHNWKDAAQGLIHHRFDFGTLPAGIYFLQLEADGKAETRRLIKAY